ncbi:MAG: hypothetical protein IE913_08245 [Halothiobacillus sp.]|nr:hypothetical protein [Halothiobacillus sp.]
MASGGGGSVDIPITEAERAQAEVSTKKWDDFIARYIPVEDQLRARVEDLNSAATRSAAVRPYLTQGGIAAGNVAQNNALMLAMGNGGYDPLGHVNGRMMEGIVSGLTDAKQNYFTQAKALADLGSGISNQALGTYNTVSQSARDKSNQLFADKTSRQIAEDAFTASLITSAMDAGTSYGMNKYVYPKMQAEAYTKFKVPQNMNVAGS